MYMPVYAHESQTMYTYKSKTNKKTFSRKYVGFLRKIRSKQNQI